MNKSGAKTDAKRSTPSIWIKQIVLYKSVAPLDEIRSIPFTPGMNIIQGLSNDSDDDFESGHGNGKTTLCRLIRYVLGEKAFGQKHVVEEVKHCFPTGYVGAIVVVEGVEWAVLRSIGRRGKDTAMCGVELAELIAADYAGPYSEFLQCLQNAGLSSLKQLDVLSGGQSIQWFHLLALCSRDQESRYDRFWNWRHARSDSGSPKITKADASLCVRAILGLLDANEPQLRTRMEELKTRLDQLKTEISDKRKEPEFHITRLRTTLVEELGITGAKDATLEEGEIFGLEQSVQTRVEALQNELGLIDKKISPLDRQINLATAQYRELLEMQEQSEAANNVTEDGADVLENVLNRLRENRQRLLELSVSYCRAGRILYGECNLVQSHLADLEQEIAKEQAIVLPQVASRDQIAAYLADQAKRLETPLGQLRQELDQLNRGKNELLERQRAINSLLERIPLVSSELFRWNDVLNGRVENHELTVLETEEDDKTKELERLTDELNNLLAQQNKRAKELGQRFNDIVQKAINTSFKGSIAINSDGIFFRINRERSLAGEAYETLAVLLADLAILIESANTSVCHPGFLIHDSPREADLNERLYQRMLEVAYSLMRDKEGNTPFQYIVTTTTEPSQVLKDSGVTQETLSGGEGSLFCKQLEMGTAGTNEETLFDSMEN